jgi:hypothetical protein
VVSLFSFYDGLRLTMNQGIRRLPIHRALIDPCLPKCFFGKRLYRHGFFNELRHTRGMLRIEFIQSLGYQSRAGSEIGALYHTVQTDTRVVRSIMRRGALQPGLSINNSYEIQRQLQQPLICLERETCPWDQR